MNDRLETKKTLTVAAFGEKFEETTGVTKFLVLRT